MVESLLHRDLSGSDIGAALAALSEGAEGRLSPMVLGDGTWLLDDSYNANPASMRSSVEAARELALHENRRLVLVLGEMRELGETSPLEHRDLGRFVASVSPGSPVFVIGVGGEAAAIVEEARERGLDAMFASDSERAIPMVLEQVTPRDLVLVKGSRGIATERIVRALSLRGGASRGGA